jgi:hypothetical protein
VGSTGYDDGVKAGRGGMHKEMCRLQFARWMDSGK